MPFISDTEATEIAKRIFSPEKFDAFVEVTELMRHLQDCVEEGKPSPECRYTDPADNLNWCRLYLRGVELHFEDLMQEIIPHYEREHD